MALLNTGSDAKDTCYVCSLLIVMLAHLTMCMVTCPFKPFRVSFIYSNLHNEYELANLYDNVS
jgi:hypothetical protein